MTTDQPRGNDPVQAAIQTSATFESNNPSFQGSGGFSCLRRTFERHIWKPMVHGAPTLAPAASGLRRGDSDGS